MSPAGLISGFVAGKGFRDNLTGKRKLDAVAKQQVHDGVLVIVAFYMKVRSVWHGGLAKVDATLESSRNVRSLDADGSRE